MIMFEGEEDAQIIALAKRLLKENESTEEELLESYKQVIRYADRRYYIDNESIIPDSDYDRLFSLLKELEKKHPEWIEPDSPTQRVPLGLSEKFPPVAHIVPMLSLDNTYNAGDLKDWDRRCRQ